MYQDLNERLAELRSKERQKVKWEQRRQELAEEIKRTAHERDQWSEQLSREQKDVDRLTGISLGALFYTLIGRKDEKLTQEEEEVLQAKLKYENAADTLSELETEMAKLEEQLTEVRFVEGEITAAMEEKRRLIEETNPSLAAELQALTDEEAEERANLKELREALSAGHAVQNALELAEEKLGSAKNWGTYDMLGGGMISTAIKHSRIDEARSAIHDAQSHLRRFQTELQDVQRNVHVEIDIGGLLTFADYFFDGFITDWLVQGRIQESLEQVGEKQSQIGRIVFELEEECRRTEAKLQELQRKRSSLIGNAQ